MTEGNSFKSVGSSSLFICTKTLTGEYGTYVSDQLKLIMDNGSVYNSKAVVLDLFNTCKLEYDFLRMILPHIKALRERRISFFCINAPKGLGKFLTEQGVDTAIQIEKSIDEVNARFKNEDFGKQAPKLELGFINPFIEAVIHTMKTQGKINPKPFTPKLRKHLLDESVDLAAIMSFKNEAFQFYIVIHFASDVAFALVENMIGEKYEELSDDVVDCISEMLNIIFGQSKPQLAPYGFDINMVRPEAITGDAIKQHMRNPITTMRLPFKSEIGWFYMELGVQKLEAMENSKKSA